MNYKFLLIFILSFTLLSCDREEVSELFGIGQTITVLNAEGESIPADISIEGDQINLSLTPAEQRIIINFLADSPTRIEVNKNPTWVTYQIDGNVLTLDIDEFGYAPEGARTDELSVKVSADGYKSRIIDFFITQTIATYEQMIEKENKAIEDFLNTKEVAEWPEDNNIITGSRSPFYKLGDSGVYMSVISKGNYEYKANERVYFRFDYYDLFTYLKTGFLGTPGGNLSNPSASTTFFLYQSLTHPYGLGVELPLNYGIAGGGEVYLIVPSQKSFVPAKVTPFLYHVKYENPGAVMKKISVQ